MSHLRALVQAVRIWRLSGCVLAAAAILLSILGCRAQPPAHGAAAPIRIPRPQVARLGESIQLLGFDLGPPVIQPAGVLQLTLYWQAVEPVQSDYLVFAQVTGPSGNVYVYKERVPGDGARPTTHWPPGEIIADPYNLALRGDGDPGFYRVWIGMLDPGASMQRLPVYVNGVRLPDDALRLDMVIEAEP